MATMATTYVRAATDEPGPEGGLANLSSRQIINCSTV
jgi:hypothetical protein